MRKPIILQRPLLRFLSTFLPILVPHRLRGPTKQKHWEDYPKGDFYKLDPASIVLLDEIKSLADNKDVSVLDLGCNVGRHLNHLYELGWHNLTGVDFSASAINDMAVKYPNLHQNIKVSAASFQDFLPICSEKYDIVYTNGATFELVHPSFNLIRNVCRIANKYVVLLIDESGHAFPRFWEYEFAKQGFQLTHLKRPVIRNLDKQRTRSLLVFERLD